METALVSFSSDIYFSAAMKRKLNWLLHSKGAGIVFEDEHIIVLNKPASLLVLPNRYNHALANLYGILHEELVGIFVVHRIDKETSGLIAFAKSAQVHQELNAQFEGRTVEKTYQAIVVGTPSKQEGTINLPPCRKQPPCRRYEG